MAPAWVPAGYAEKAPTTRVVAFLLRYRQGGFMAILPQVEAVAAILSVLEAEGAAPSLHYDDGALRDTQAKEPWGVSGGGLPLKLPCPLPQSCYWPEPADHCCFVGDAKAGAAQEASTPDQGSGLAGTCRGWACLEGSRGRAGAPATGAWRSWTRSPWKRRRDWLRHWGWPARGSHWPTHL